MDAAAIKRAAKMLTEARWPGERRERLPAELRPRSMDEAYAIQLAMVAELGESVAGWKVASVEGLGLLMGIILSSRTFKSPAVVPAVQVPLLGAEAEIAFRFDATLSRRDEPYSRDDVEAATTALAAIEIVDSRFRDYSGTPPIERAADFMSNGGLVVGTIRDDWRSIDLVGIEACLLVEDVEIVRRAGGHATKDPLILAIALSNELRRYDGIRAGQIVTTGTYTGLNYANPGSRVRAGFQGFGSAEVTFST
jgi:2-keto-4-pentenoate hydratase